MKGLKNFVLAMAIMMCATLLVKFDSRADELADELSYTVQNDYYSYSVSAVVSGAQFYGIPEQTNASSDETIRIYYRTNSGQYLPMTGSQHPTFLVYSIERTDKTNGNVNTYGDAYLGDWYTIFAAKSSWSGYIFASDAAARAYFQNGDETGLVQAPEPPATPLMNGQYDDSLPGVSGFVVKTLSTKDCHGAVGDGYNMCLGLRWSRPENWQSGDYYAIYVDLAYNYNTYWSTQRRYGSASMVDVSQFFNSPILIDSLACDLCAHDFADHVSTSLVNSMDRVTSFTIESVSKIYIQSCRSVNGELLHGDWYVYTVNKDKSLTLDYNKQDVGTGQIIQGTVDPDESGVFPSESTTKGTIAAPQKDNTSGFAGLDFSDLSGTFSTFSRILENLMGALGSFPSLFATVFQFLPYELNSSIIFLFYLAIIVGLIRIFT